MDRNAGKLSEAFLSTVQAMMKKAGEDDKKDMVGLLQVVLQIYAGRELTKDDGSEGASGRLNVLLTAGENQWDAIVAQMANEGDEAGLNAEISRRMERLIMTTTRGSFSERIQAEYITEAKERIEAAFKKKGAS